MKADKKFFLSLGGILTIALFIAVLQMLFLSKSEDRLPDEEPGFEPPQSLPNTQNEPKVPPLYYIDQILKDMARGHIAFNVPDSVMHVGQASTIQLLLDLSKPIEELESMIRTSGVVESHQIKVSEIMEARLTGNGFQITAITPEEQPVSTIETTEWKWDIKAVEQGNQRLHLTLSAIIQIAGQKQKRSIQTFDREILIKVSFGKRVSNFIGKNWQWLWTALFIPVVSWLWKRKKRVKKKSW